MSGPHGRDGSGRFVRGVSGNAGGRPRAAASFTTRAKELSLDVLENMAKIATTGRGPAAVQAGALVLAYGEGKPVERIDLTARRGGPDALGGSPDAARSRLEALIIEAQATSGAVLQQATNDAEPDHESGEKGQITEVSPVLTADGSASCPTVAPDVPAEGTP